MKQLFSRAFLVGALFLAWAGSSYAQQDTVILKNGQRWAAERMSLSSQTLTADLKNHPIGKTLDISVHDLVGIRFADGFLLPFRNGVPVRDDVYAAPTLKGSFGRVSAEGMVHLTREEIHAMYGDVRYQYGYQNYRKVLWSGLGKIAVGASGALICHAKDPTVWEIPKDTMRPDAFNYSHGNLNPGWLTGTCFFYGLAIAGAVDVYLSGAGHRHLLDTRADWTPPTKEQVTLQYVAGSAMIVAGLGGMAGCYRYWERHRHWVYIDGLNKGEEGESPAGKITWFWMSGAALLTHLGISTLEMGAINNALRKHTDGTTAHPVQYSFGPAEHGYGLTVRF